MQPDKLDKIWSLDGVAYDLIAHSSQGYQITKTPGSCAVSLGASKMNDSGFCFGRINILPSAMLHVVCALV